jgi:hypothetical protein
MRVMGRVDEYDVVIVCWYRTTHNASYDLARALYEGRITKFKGRHFDANHESITGTANHMMSNFSRTSRT